MSVLRKAKRWLNRVRFGPTVAVRRNRPLKRLGTPYGGWTFEDGPELRGCTIVSAGLGEDASFDIEFARTYGARVVIVDPTPRAIAHYEAICSRLGKAAETGYLVGGKQPVEAYPLDGVGASQLVLVPKALWTESTTLKFYLPPDPSHVSHSISNYQNNYSEDTPSIIVEAVTMEELLHDYNIIPWGMCKPQPTGDRALLPNIGELPIERLRLEDIRKARSDSPIVRIAWAAPEFEALTLPFSVAAGRLCC